jgi:cytochrome c2
MPSTIAPRLAWVAAAIAATALAATPFFCNNTATTEIYSRCEACHSLEYNRPDRATVASSAARPAAYPVSTTRPR